MDRSLMHLSYNISKLILSLHRNIRFLTYNFTILCMCIFFLILSTTV